MRTLNYVTTAGALMLLCGSAKATPSPSFSRLEREALLSGDIVSRPMHFETDAGSYFGGLSYSIVHAPAATVLVLRSSRHDRPAVRS